MKRMAALGGALLLTLVLAAPAAANEKALVVDDDFTDGAPVTLAGWGFECTQPIYWSSQGSETLWLWFADDTVDLTFDGPWIRGQYVYEGTDSFSTEPFGEGTVISGPFKTTSHLYDHDPGPPETWREVVSGLWWGVRAPGFGAILHETLGLHQNVEKTVPEWTYEWVKGAVGSQLLDVEEICEALGYELAP